MTNPREYFRTLESAHLPVEKGQLLFVTAKSPALKRRADLTLFIPETSLPMESLPVVILLHGVYGSHWSWALSGKAHLTLQEMIDQTEISPMILAMPSDGLWGDGSGYLNHSGEDFETWITKDAPQAVAQVTGNPLNAPHFIAGLSMGGFGAMRLGAIDPERFCGFSGHSSITRSGELEQFVEEPLGSYEANTEIKQSVFSGMIENRENLKPFRFDCGTEDSLLKGNRELHAQLKDAGIPHLYEEYPGGHDWSYWRESVKRTFLFFQSILSPQDSE